MSKEITYRKVYCRDRKPSFSLSSCETYSTSLGELMWWGTDWHLDVGYERPEYWFEPIENNSEKVLEENTDKF